MLGYEYLLDKKTGKRYIVGEGHKCRFCKKELAEGEEAYFADKERVIACEKCVKSEAVSVVSDALNMSYMWGIVKNRGVMK